MLFTKLLLVLGSLTVLFLRGEAAGAVCGQRSTYPTIQALPGKPGKNGAPGAPGPKGKPGMDGTDGEQGPVGPVGPQGPVGPVGPQGPVGPVGPQGPVGPVGPQGPVGPVGPQGPVGPVGPQGPVGPVGPQGPAGPVGPQGPVGLVGLQGIAGMNGTDGEKGPVGPQGPVGAPGSDGRSGSDGSPGPPGTVPDAVIEQLRADILEEVLKLLPCKGFFRNNPATSCKEIHDCDPTAPSGYYWVNTTTGVHQITCSAGRITDCYDAMTQGANESGVYTIHPITTNSSFNVYCDMQTDGGGWTVLLKRQDGSVDFQRNWADYKNGFGNLEGEHWLGLDNMHLLTHLSSESPPPLSGVTAQLRVDLADWEGNTAFAKYGQFSVGDEDSDYTLSVSGYQSASTAGDSLTSHNGQRFSTPDRDNDVWGNGDHCAVYFHGPWWHFGCYSSLLTGKYYTSGGPWPRPYGVKWNDWMGSYSLRVAEMKIRPGGV